MTLEAELKQVIIEGLAITHIDPATVGDDTPIFGAEGLGLDSLDAVEVVVLLQRKYGVKIAGIEQNRDALTSLRTLADYIRESRGDA